jgi:hypothetical protein
MVRCFADVVIKAAQSPTLMQGLKITAGLTMDAQPTEPVG